MKKYAFTSNIIYTQQNANIDKENGVIRNIVLATKGLNKNGTYFSERFLNELLEFGQNSKNGIKARFGHPNMCSTSLGSVVGYFTNFRIEADGLYGDLHFLEISKKTQVEGRGISMYDYLFSLAEESSHFFGNSIHIWASDVDEVVKNENNEEIIYTGHKLEDWIASDLVDDPAATDSLFSSVEDLGTKTTDFLDANPKIFDVIEKNPKILLDFFERYENYINRKNFNTNNKMSLFNKLASFFAKKFDIEVTLGNGDIITIITEAQDLEVGDPVKDSEGKPLEDGEYVLADGRTIVVEAGLIVEIKEKQDENTASDNQDAQVSEQVTQSIEKFNKTLENTDEKMNLLADCVLELNKKFEMLAKGVKSNFQSFEDRGENNQDKDVSYSISIDELKKRREMYKK